MLPVGRMYYCPVEDHYVAERGFEPRAGMCVFCYMHRKIDDLELALEKRDTEPCPPPDVEFG
jgi:hypothetical protein